MACRKHGPEHAVRLKAAATGDRPGPWGCDVCNPPAVGLIEHGHVEWRDGRATNKYEPIARNSPELVRRCLARQKLVRQRDTVGTGRALEVIVPKAKVEEPEVEDLPKPVTKVFVDAAQADLTPAEEKPAPKPKQVKPAAKKSTSKAKGGRKKAPPQDAGLF